MSITKLDQLFEVLKSKPKKRLVAAYANDAHTIEAVNDAVEKGIVDALLVGDEAVMRNVCREHGFDESKFRMVHEPNESKAAFKAVQLINEGEGDLLMKGLVSTDKYMKAILNKETGIMNPGAVLSHVTVMESPNYHKLLIVGDVAIIPLPDLKQKIAILNYLIAAAKGLGIEKPKVAVLSASEQVLVGMPSCVDAALLSKMAERGQISGAFVDGPLSLDAAIDMESAQIKKLTGPVAGDADCMLFPNIESGNIFYKANTKMANAELGAFVAGARVPCVLSSRGDTALTKLYSIALAALLAK
ncbi:MAG: bifunctional enoyl-CoA hydratase/phosphate acetyltransferase [Lentimicrobium sp.]|jgi:phosphate butyryltransferase|nr:bifunctional enoyl-CoA hydratase/phosphate acetyltransferase [Lentimicrobium sp.]MDD2529158.1 bifunctional enoyl-CoA hydratase/phosphate acetyltransferase [Lentimicrobiaceae bacterium]MDD4597742.1 bifunctional enoyl-CoA hydratase/phosphate acetyltransferase [Lentimicrobiaceae bacterium]MDY0025836.1 bifunctional enoyl-CoA hydratase/phosphate acetyltransferase [Lentimicrobium sp.]HAH59637.1 phosphate butyryltransferase [Bacteroidales bacterium]